MVWRLQRVLPQVPSTDSESSWEDRWCLSPLPPGHLQHPSHPQSPQHCRWSHPPDTKLLQSATIREETEESPSQDKQTERQLHPPGCQEAELPPVLAPPPLSYPTNHWTLTPTPPPQLTRTHTHTHTHTETSTGHLYSIGLTSFNYLFCQSEQKRLLLVTLNSLDKLFALHHLYSALFVCLFISLIYTICHVPMPLYPFFYIIIFSFLFNVLFYFFSYMSLFVYL